MLPLVMSHQLCLGRSRLCALPQTLSLLMKKTLLASRLLQEYAPLSTEPDAGACERRGNCHHTERVGGLVDSRRR